MRRTEKKQVCVWLATYRPVTVKAEIFRFGDLKASKQISKIEHAEPIGLGFAKSLQLGEHLHVILVIARPIGLRTNQSSNEVGFPTDELLAYDIKVSVSDDPDNKAMSLKDLGLVSGKNSIVYGHQSDGLLPTFFLRGDNTPLNLLHGSCRKLHGKGEDCLVAADELISSSFTDLNRRPSALLLTGDQIYADDVAYPLSHYLTQLGIHLSGWEEQIDGIGKRLTEIQIGERQSLVEKYAGFTSPNASNHLLSFGEFVSMYLLAWNVENWPDRFADITTIPPENRKKYLAQIRQLQKTRKDLPKVRRVLANIPTYMIFDDHEITDDWNITREWHEGVRTSKCGKQIVANGLVAYWAFQGWGNDPALYSDDFVGKIVEYFGKNDNASKAEKTAFEDHLWHFHGWTYSVPLSMHTIVADCRTQRQYDTNDGAPQLLSSGGLHSILHACQEANFKKGDPIIMVTPTPVFGFLLVEALQKAASKITGVYKPDLETWFANESGLVNLLSFILQTLEPRHCIFLSGDVHYGFTISAVFALLQKEHGKDEHLSMSITQLNSSALKTTSLVKIAFVSEILGRIRQLFPFKQVVRVGWVNGGSSRLLSKSLRVKSRPTLHLQIQSGKEDYRSIVKRPPDWIEARSIVKTSGSIIPPLIISDNNIGLVTVDKNNIVHRLLVRKDTKGKTKIHSAIVEMNRGKNRLEELVDTKILQVAQSSITEA